MKKTKGRGQAAGVLCWPVPIILAGTLFIVGFAANGSAAVEGVSDTCDESLGLGRVARDGNLCVILDNIIVGVASGYTVDQAAKALEQCEGWTVKSKLYTSRLIFAEYAPDNLTLAQLDAKRAEIEALPWAKHVERNFLYRIPHRGQSTQ